MSGVLNQRFSEQGAKPGLALGWNVSAESSLVRVGSFEDLELGSLGIERFNWYEPPPDLSAFALAIFDQGVTAGEAVEDFYEGFVEAPYLLLWSDIFEEEAFVSPEDFDWMAGDWHSLWGELEPGEIETAAGSDFDVPGYITTWAEVSSSDAAEFAGPTSVEIFDAWTPLGS